MTRLVSLRQKPAFPLGQLLSTLLLPFILVGKSHAVTCAENTSPTLACDNLVINQAVTDITVGQVVGGPSAAISVTSAGSVANLNINNTVGTTGITSHGIQNAGTITTLNNAATIAGRNGIFNSNSRAPVSIGSIFNSGTISGSTTGDAIYNSAYGSISSISNHGTLSGQYGINNNSNPGQPGRIGSISNIGASAQISGTLVAISNHGDITDITNTGLIKNSGTTGNGIYNSGTIARITNAAQIQGGTYSISNSGSIGTIINSSTSEGTGIRGGTTGINNTGTIGTLNNAQDALYYTGKLPTNYNAIISSLTSYGKLQVVSPSGTTTFGIAPGSTVTNATYTAVLSGVNASNLANKTGTYGGGLVATNWQLTNSSGSLWDLTTSSPIVVAPNTGSNSGNNLGNAITVAYAGSAAVLANGTSLTGAVQSLTPSQANALANVHAEGYSSNLTINLEQMGHVTNTVMDRIHTPLSAQSGSAFEMDQGRYMWVDITSMKGTVDSYDNLAGFGYQLSNVIIGGDLLRDKSGGFGVFGGVGYTTMKEPEQVEQDFRSTNYYLGLYGGKYLPNNLKLSGAVGYVFSDSTAMRDNPNVGQFTGGQASSEYQSNGVYGALKLSRPYLLRERLTITPFAGASYSQLWMRQANESGGDDFNYSISATSGRSALTFVGGELLMPLSNGTMNPISLIGFYRFGYDWYADKDSAHDITANSALFGSFTQIGANKGPVNNLMGLGLQGNIARGVSIRAGIVGRISTYGNELGGGGEIRWEL